MRPKYIAILKFALATCVLLMAVIWTPIFAWAQDENRAPFVSNIHAQQRAGTKLVDITYDVDDPDGDLLIITVSMSDDGGSTFAIPAMSFVDGSDVGPGIVPGTGKQIVWDAGADVPDVYGANYRIRITANDGQAGGVTIIGQDGASMALIPAGEFQMGDHFNEGWDDELPVHMVYLDSFYMDIYEVTNAQYQKFVDATGHGVPNYWNDSNYNAAEQPVVGVSWHDAVAYAEWAGKRLPTEAEREKAARGGLSGKRYPWGDEISHDDANYSGAGGKDVWSYTSPVGSFAPNGYGLYDMAGNVGEWCADLYGRGYYANSPSNNPSGAGSGSDRVLRGGSWYDSPGILGRSLRVAARNGDVPTSTSSDMGFRCVSQD